MTAGSVIIHSEDVRTKGKVRLLQLRFTLPKTNARLPPVFKRLTSMRFRRTAKEALRSEFIAVPRLAFSQARETMYRSGYLQNQSGRFPRLSELKKQQV